MEIDDWTRHLMKETIDGAKSDDGEKALVTLPRASAGVLISRA